MRQQKEISSSDHSSYQYCKWRNKIGGGTCVLCGRSWHNANGSTIELVAHHIWSMAKYPELRYDPSNGIILCQDCHKLIHRAMRVGTLTEHDVLNLKKQHQILSAKYFDIALEQLQREW